MLDDNIQEKKWTRDKTILERNDAALTYFYPNAVSYLVEGIWQPQQDVDTLIYSCHRMY